MNVCQLSSPHNTPVCTHILSSCRLLLSLQATYKWTQCDAVMYCHGCRIISAPDRFLLRLPLSVCQRWRAAVLERVWLWHVFMDVTNEEGTKKKLIIFWWGKNSFRASLKFAYSDSSKVSCKIDVIIDMLSSGTQLERKSLRACVVRSHVCMYECRSVLCMWMCLSN